MPKFIINKSTTPQKNSPTDSDSDQTLQKTEVIIKIAKSQGVDFGSGNAQERIRYFIKLGLLPLAVRKSNVKSQSQKNSSLSTLTKDSPVGHLPNWTVERLKYIQKLYDQGFSYPKIAGMIKSEKNREKADTTKKETEQIQKPIVEANPRFVLIQKNGLDQLKVKELVQAEVARAQTLGSPTAPSGGNDNDTGDNSRLITTKRVIEIATNLGVNFGTGNAGERIRYFIKLGILPHVRRTTSADSEKGFELNSGHLPFWTIKRLTYVKNLYKKGYSYPQIAQKIKEMESKKTQQNISKSNKVSPILQPASAHHGISLFGKSGLDEKEVSRRLKIHEQNIIRFIDKKLGFLPGVGPFIDASYLNTQNPAGKLLLYTKGFVITISLATLLSAGIYAGKNYVESNRKNQSASKQIADSANKLGSVLAASSVDHKFYVDADMQVLGTSIFRENITAPNVVYDVTGGTGISVTGGQNPVVALNTNAIVTSVNTLPGALTIAGSGGTSISSSGSTITINSTSGALTSESDTLSTVTGRGASTSTAVTLSGGATIGTSLTLSAFSSNGGVIYTNGSGTAAQATAGTSSQCLLGGTTPSFGSCTAGSGMTSFTLSGDSGTDQTIADSNTLEIAGGTGITTAGSNTDILTVTFESTEIGTTTFG